MIRISKIRWSPLIALDTDPYASQEIVPGVVSAGLEIVAGEGVKGFRLAHAAGIVEPAEQDEARQNAQRDEDLEAAQGSRGVHGATNGRIER